MMRRMNARPSMHSGCGASDHAGGYASDSADGANNLWSGEATPENLHLSVFITRTLLSERSLAAALQEPSGIKWDIVGLREVRRAGGAYRALNSGHDL